VLWVRSYFVWDVIDRRLTWLTDRGVPDDHYFLLERLSSHNGRVLFERYRGLYHAHWRSLNPPHWVISNEHRWYPELKETTFQRWGFALRNVDYEPLDGMQLVIGLPQWFLFLASLPLPLACLSWVRRQRHFRISGRCLKCGYDLRATPDRCPECGTFPTKVKA
jgi:hypothetical protein